MRRLALRLGAALALALAACHPARPKGPAVPPTDFLRGYVGQQRVLRFQADRARLVVRKKDPAQLPGTCDAAVDVRSARLEKGAPFVVLETLGTPGVERARSRCKAIPATITLNLTGFGADSPAQVTARLDQLLPTPDGYLRAYGVAFDPPPAGEPAVAACNQPTAPDE